MANYHENMVGQARPTSTFENWRTTTAKQQQLKDDLQRLTDGLLARAEQIKRETWPFDHARLIILWGKPGRGKSHLVEAVINHIKVHDPDLLQRVWLARENFAIANLVPFSYGDRPIVIIDDLWSEKNSLDELHPATDIRAFMDLVTRFYEERRLILLTSNFPLRRGIVEKVRETDQTGRVLSRLQEMIAHSGEIQVTGPDHRRELARSGRGGSVFEL